MRYYDTLATYERNGFEIIVDKSYEELSPYDLFDDSVTDIKQICQDIDSGKLDWFFLRVRALIDGHEMGSAYVGGCLYEDAKEVLTDGYAEDLIEQAIAEAKRQVWPLMRKLQAINAEMEADAIKG